MSENKPLKKLPKASREVKEKAFPATFHKGWNQMQVTCQMGRFHKVVRTFKEYS